MCDDQRKALSLVILTNVELWEALNVAGRRVNLDRTEVAVAKRLSTVLRAASHAQQTEQFQSAFQERDP